MRTTFESLVLERTLTEMASRRAGVIGDLIDAGVIESDEEAPLLRQLCFAVWQPVWDELEQVIGILGVTKRRFCEAAMVDALVRARQIMEQEGMTKVEMLLMRDRVHLSENRGERA